MILPAVFDRYRNGIDAELKSVLAEQQLPLYDMMRYHLGWIDAQGNLCQNSSGKALRPVLSLLACEAVGGEPSRALPVAVAIELIHNYSLIHDDIQDDDRERRHRPTVWSIWGKPQAINAGTAMRILASLALSRVKDGEITVDKRLRAQRLLDECTLRLIEGQYLDISYESRLDIGINDYLTMIEGKTAALIACSLEAGALVGTDNEKTIKDFREIGKNLGLAFQIRDDILGIWGDEKKTGKPIGSDIRRRKKTLPIVYALEKSEGELKKELIRVYQNGALNDGGVDMVLKVLDAVDAQSQTQKMADKYCDKAMDGIRKADLVPSARRDLEELFRFLVVRSF